MIWGGRNKGRSSAQVNSVIHYYAICSRANICCKNDKVLLVLSHHTDFLFLFVSICIKRNGHFINILQTTVTVPVFTNAMDGLGRDVRWVYFEQTNNGFIRNHSYYAALILA